MIRAWLKRAIVASGLSQAEVARRLGVRRDVITNMIKGERRITAQELLRLEDILQTDAPKPGSKSGKNDLTYVNFPASSGRSTRTATSLTVVGEVAGGYWKQMNFADFEEREVSYLLDQKWPPKAIYGLIVRGESINRQARNGDIVVVIGLEHAPREFRDGDWVVVERRRAGDLVETTVKQARREETGWQLVPDSDDPRFQDVITLSDDDQTEEVRVVGLVLDVIRPMTKL